MLYSDRRKFLIALGALPLAGCGFQPVYQQGGAARALHGDIQFNLIDSREGFVLLEQLEKRLGAGEASARFAANIVLMIEETELTLTAATGLVRTTLNGTIKLTVTDRTSGTEVFADKLRDTVAYSGNEETLVTSSSKRDAYDRLVLTLADQIVLRLTSTAENWAG